MAAFWPRILLMRKPALGARFALLLVCLPLTGQQTFGAHSLDSLNDAQLEFPALTLTNAQPFSFPATLSWIEAAPAEFLPSLPAVGVQRSTAAAARLLDSSKQSVDVTERNLLDYAHGEIGVLYGHSIGKFDRDLEAGYILGQVGDDKLQISVGGMYEHWSGKTPRFGR